MIFALLLALAAPAPLGPIAPAPTEPKLFRDWVVACDNGRACEAQSLMPKADSEGWLILGVMRDGAPGAAPRIAFPGSQEEAPHPAALYADGRKLAVTIADGALGAEVVAGKDLLISALRSAARLEARDARGNSLGNVSLAGASAALLYMDERQRRLGTVTAIVRPGPKPVSAVPPPPAYPVVAAAALSARPPRRMAKTDWMKLRLEACGEEDAGRGGDPDFYRLDATHSLAYIPVSCLSGAYNHAALLRVAGETGSWRAPDMDVPVDQAGEGEPAGVVFNAGWDGASGELGMFMKGRGIGDCGSAERFVWDGRRFRLVEQTRMDECRGSLDWLHTWHAEVVRR
jgi:hypothetical protein